MTTTNTPQPQHDYAYIPTTWLSQPLRVTVLRAAGPHYSTALIHHPDLGATTRSIPNTDLRDEWTVGPSDQVWAGYQGEQTWAQIAEESYARVTEDRDLAARLTALGIARKRRHYAGSGGTATQAGEADASLHLSNDELSYLLDLAERGKKQEAATEEN